MTTKITEHYFQFGTQKYFRGNAHIVEIGSYGEKKDPIGAQAYLDPEAKVKAEHLEGRVERGPRVKINWNEVSKADLEAKADLKFFSLGKKAAVSFNYEKAKDARLELINLAIMEHPLKAMLNKDAHGACRFLAKEGNDGRIVSEVWVAVDIELGEQFATQGSSAVSVQAFGSSLDVTFTGGKHGSQTITLSKGTTFAYKFHKVTKWRDRDKTEIEDMEADYKGMQ